MWKAGNCAWPVDKDKASVAVASAVIATVAGSYPCWARDFFSLLGSSSKRYLEITYAGLEIVKEKPHQFDSRFLSAVMYLFEPKEMGVSISSQSTEFAEWYGFGLVGLRCPDIDGGVNDDCNIRRRILSLGKRHFKKLPREIQTSIDLVKPQIPPMLKQVIETRR